MYNKLETVQAERKRKRERERERERRPIQPTFDF